MLGPEQGFFMQSTPPTPPFPAAPGVSQLFFSLLREAIKTVPERGMTPNEHSDRRTLAAFPGLEGWSATDEAFDAMACAYDQFERSYVAIFVRHLGTVQVASSLEALREPRARQYLRARKRIAKQLLTLDQNLHQQMIQVARS